jgi:opacity protein-like surface antigen
VRVPPLVIVVAALLAGAPSAPAQDRGFLADVDALGSAPLGHIGGRSARDILDLGYGVRAEVLYQIHGHLSTGVSVTALSYDVTVAEGFVTARANATAVPVYAVARLHSTRGSGFGTYAEAGIGLMAWNRDPVGVGTATRTQTAFSYDIGVGASHLLSRRWDVRVGAQYQQAVTGPGELWARGEDPKFLTINLGLVFRPR